MTDAIDARLAAARGWAAECAALALTYFANRDAMAARLKGAQDVVTAADLAVENLLRQRIAEAFPGDEVLGEEGGGRPADRLWVVDPIDGTANFARGKPHWCVSIGFAEAGRPKIGVIAAPVHGETWWAREGGGAFRDGARLRASGVVDPGEATLEIGWTPRRPTEAYIAMERAAFAAGMLVHRCGSAALGVAYVADGRIDGFAELHTNAWDVAAGHVIAVEAGAHVSDFFVPGAMTGGNAYLCCAPGLADVMRQVSGVA